MGDDRQVSRIAAVPCAVPLTAPLSPPAPREIVQLRPSGRGNVRRLPVPNAGRRIDPRRQRQGRLDQLAGCCAEDAAARLYRAAGAEILEKRLSIGGGELDIVVLEGATLVFVEVKRRKGPLHDDPVSPAQWKRLEQAASHYILRHAEQTGIMRCARFDVAIVDAEGRVSIVRNARTGEQD
ncbi:MAG: YraN family protein [Pseudomonadota bacterium]